MAFDVVKNVLTKFFADVKDYVSPVKKAEKELDDFNKKQKEVQDQSKKTGKEFKSSLGSIAEGIGKLIPGLDQIAGGFKRSEEGAKAFGKGAKLAIASTGIGLLIAGVTSLIEWFGELSEKAPQDLTFVEKSVLDLGNSISGVLDEAELGTISWSNAILLVLNPALGAQAIAHDQLLEKRQKEKAEWDKAIIRLKEQAKFQEDFEKRVADAEKRRQDANKKAADERAKAAKEAADKAAADQAYWEAEEQREIEGAITQAQREEDHYQATLKQLEVDTQAAVQAKENEEFFAFAAVEQKKRDDESAAAADAAAAREQAKQVLANAGLDILQDQLIAEFASSKNEKKNAIAMNVINTLIGIGRIWAGPGNYYVKLAQSLALGAIGAINGAKISKQEFEKPPKFEEGGQIPAGGGLITGRRHSHGGVKFRAGGRLNEAEGGEFIVNRKATRRFLPQLHAINATGLYADGGVIQGEISRVQSEIKDSMSNTRTVLVLEDFRRANTRLDVVENLSKL